MNPFTPGTGESDIFTLATRQGRAHMLQKRLDELTKRGLTLDQALYEMRTGGNPADDALLEAMGEKPSHFRTQQLQNQSHTERLKRLAEDNKNAEKTSAEVAATLAKNERNLAFNARVTELTDRGFSIDQAIMQMRMNPNDAALLKSMGAV